MAVSISGEGVISGSSSYSFDSNVSIAGTTTIEDVTSVDSVGIITAQSGIHVTGGVQVGTGATITGSTNIITASTNGSERFRVTSDGEVLINKTTSPTIDTNFVVSGASPVSVYTGQQLIEGSETSGAADTGGALIFGGHDGSEVRNWANIYGMKENGTGSNTASYMSFHTRPAGGAPTERVRITSAGKFGINTTGPNATLTVGPVDTPGFNRGAVAIKAVQDGNSLPTNIYLEEESGAEGYLLSIDSDGDLNFHNSGAAAPTVTFSDDDKVGVGTDSPAQKLHVVGRIIKTEYEPGELIECIETIANGIQVTVGSGSYTPTNVTAVQDLSSTYADINGSEITYNVPVGTKRLIYDFWVYMRDKDVGPLLHFKGLTTPDGSSTYSTVNTSRATWRGPTASADMQIWIHNRMVLFDYDVEENIGDGMVKPLGGTTRKMKFQCREYSASYEADLHMTQHWDGGGTDILVRPQIRIAAYA